MFLKRNPKLKVMVMGRFLRSWIYIYIIPNGLLIKKHLSKEFPKKYSCSLKVQLRQSTRLVAIAINAKVIWYTGVKL